MSLIDSAESMPVEEASEGGEGYADTSSQYTSDGQDVSHETDQNATSHENPVPEDSLWYYDDDNVGAGNKPEWLLEKFGGNMAKQAKAYNDLQKRFGAFKGAPEAYEFNEEVKEGVDFANPVLQEFLEYAKTSNASQDFVNKAIQIYKESMRLMNPDPVAELKKLGPNAKQDLMNLERFMQNHFTPEEVELGKSMLTDADKVRFIEKLARLSTRPTTQPQSSSAPRESKEDVLRLIHDPRYAEDENFRKQVRERLAQYV